MKKTQEGFTLVEMMLVAAISAVILFGVFGILQVSNKQLETIHAKISLEESLREALFKMTQEIRQAPQKVVGNRILLTEDDFLLKTADQISNVATGADGIEHATKIFFQIPTSASLVVDDKYEPIWKNDIQYQLDENTHQILRISGDILTLEKKEAVLANNVTSLEFSRKTSDATLITIKVEVQKELPDGRMVPDKPILITAQAEARNP